MDQSKKTTLFFKQLYGKEFQILSLITLFTLGALFYWHYIETQKIRSQFIQDQLSIIVRNKQYDIETALNSVYTNVRAITLIPSIRSLNGLNRVSADEDMIKSGRFTLDAKQTIQEIYNNIKTSIHVSEVYVVLEGLDFKKGQVPFVMFDNMYFNNKPFNAKADKVKTADSPEEDEEFEYAYFPEQIANIKSKYPTFSFTKPEEIPAFFSPVMRTCDNDQYPSIKHSDVHNTFGFLYSVPFYNATTGALSGVVSAITRTNILEALLLDVPYIPLTDEDFTDQKAANWNMPSPVNFMLSDNTYGIQIYDRRLPNLPKIMDAPGDQGQVLKIKINIHSDTEWTLRYFLPETLIAQSCIQHNIFFAVLIIVILGALGAAATALHLLKQIQTRLGGKPEEVAKIVQDVSEGNLEFAISSEVIANSVLGNMRKMLSTLQAAKLQAIENLRIRQALDNVSTNVIIVNNHRELIYQNKAFQKMLEHTQNNATTLCNIAFEHINANQITTAIKSEFKHEKCTFALTASPVITDNGEYLGTVLEWHDRSEEISIEAEIAELVTKATRGDLSDRAKIDNKKGFTKILATGINQLLETSESGLKEAVYVLNALSQGDLTKEIKNQYSGIFDQLKQDSNKTVKNLKTLILGINNSATSINNSSHDIATGNQDLSIRTEKQATSLQKITTNMGKLSTIVKQNSEHAKEANKMALVASSIAIQGGKVVGNVVDTMLDIKKSSSKIVDIISVIDSIALQTNILALNAAVESARAGEQGRGFSVVASEVRALAQRSAGAAKEIKQLISNSVDKVEHGAKLVAAAGKTTEEIVNSVQHVTSIMSEIASASLEQSEGIMQIETGLSQLDEVTQQNMVLVTQANLAASSLEQQSQTLSEGIALFKVRE